jgi:SNF2 family DNA or RNA helicase
MRAYMDDPSLTEHDFMKKISYPDLIEEADGATFYTKPRILQLACFILGIDYPGFCFFIDMGGGKTKVALDIVNHRRVRDYVRRTLVIVPYPQNAITWEDQVKIHAPNLRVVKLLGTVEERDAAIIENADIFVINYMGLHVMMCDLIRELTDAERELNKKRDARKVLKKHRFKTGRRINKAKAEAFAALWDCVIFDESQFIGGHDTSQFELCAMLAMKARFSYVLTGTPFDRDPGPLWSQFFLADLGATFGPKFTLFRSVFYDTQVSNFATKHKFNNAHEKDLQRMMKNRSIIYNDTEFTDLPPVTYQVMHVNMARGMVPYYEQRKTALRDAMAKRDINLIENKYHQMRAITSGFVIGDVIEGETKYRVRQEFQDNPKMEAMRAIVLGIPYNRKITIYHEYVFTGDLLDEMFAKLNIKSARLGGGRDGAKELRKFLDDPTCRGLVAQSNSSVGANLQHACNYCCYYETPTSPRIRKQSEKRFPREGQDKRVFIYDLVMTGTIDTDIRDDLYSGLDFLDRLLRS